MNNKLYIIVNKSSSVTSELQKALFSEFAEFLRNVRHLGQKAAQRAKTYFWTCPNSWTSCNSSHWSQEIFSPKHMDTCDSLSQMVGQPFLQGTAWY